MPQPQTHSFEENKRVTLGQLMSEIKENPLLYGVTFSGGEPFCQPGPLAILGQQIKKAGMHLMCYSGYTYEQLLKRAETEPGCDRITQCSGCSGGWPISDC